MRSALRKAKNEKVKGNSRKLNILLKLIIPAAIVLSFFLFLKLTTKYWDGKNKVSFAFQKSNGDIGIVVLDPKLSEETTLIVPGDTEINVARNYGIFRIKNVWQLGINERLGGDLLVSTITNNFLFPTILWSDQNLSNPLKFIFSQKATNIPFGDRVGMAIFSLSRKSINITEIDLGKNQFLKKQVLTDGSPGFVINGPVSGRLTVYFSDNNFSDKNLKFALIDKTGVYGVANGVGSILEVLGGKVVLIDRKPEEKDLDCKVYGKSIDAIEKMVEQFNCKKTNDQSEFDLMMEIGAGFAKRF